jgi:thioredoxin-related protein
MVPGCPAKKSRKSCQKIKKTLRPQRSLCEITIHDFDPFRVTIQATRCAEKGKKLIDTYEGVWDILEKLS